ncbi:MAG: MBL fold metallo-hydrolase [Bacteroidia bacterium]|nr:MBL fold metallo-hydrolase [Bacteroidia bacterium]
MEIHKIVFSPIKVNTYILADQSGKCAVIDCGCYDENEFKILTDFIMGKKLEPVLLLNTHCHLDHIFGNGMFLKKYNLGAYCHSEEKMNRTNAVLYSQFFGLTMDSPPEPAGFITDGQTVSFGSEILVALHIPGHAPGSLAFYSKNNGAIFTGDALFSGSIGKTDIPGGDHSMLIDSIQSKLFVLPPETVVYPGHGEATTIGMEMKSNPYFRK